MALAYDDSRAPLGPIEREQLVQAVQHGGLAGLDSP